MSEWKTRITKVQVVKPAKEAGEACLVLIYPPGPDMGKRFPLQRSESIAHFKLVVLTEYEVKTVEFAIEGIFQK